MDDLAPKETNWMPAEWKARTLFKTPFRLGGILVLLKANLRAL